MADTYFTEEQLKSLPVDTLVTITMTLQNNVIDLKRSVDQLTEQIRIMNQRMYGRKTEKESLLYKQEQLDLAFNETEVLADEDSEDEEPELQVVCHKRQKGQKEESLKKITNHRDEYIELSEEELEEKFGKNGWKKLPYQIVTKLEHIPASFEAVTYHIGVYAAKDNETIVRAEKPAELWEGSICTPTLLASIMVAKFVNSLPLYRQEAAYKANDVMISRRTMASWIIRAYDRYLQYFYNAMKKKLVQQTILHADETPFLVTKDGRAAGSKSYMWVYCGGVEKESENIILYDYCHTRGSDNPRRFLSEFKGILITDGYQAYHKLEKENPESFTVAGCWVHAKRKFSEIINYLSNFWGKYVHIKFYYNANYTDDRETNPIWTCDYEVNGLLYKFVPENDCLFGVFNELNDPYYTSLKDNSIDLLQYVETHRMEINEISQEDFIKQVQEENFKVLKNILDKIESGNYELTENGYQRKDTISK